MHAVFDLVEHGVGGGGRPDETPLWEVLSEVMSQRGVTSFRAFARLMGVSGTTIHAIAQGHRPKASTLHYMEQRLGLTANELLIAAGYLEEPRHIDAARLRLLALIDSLDDEKRDAVVDYARYLIFRDR